MAPVILTCFCMGLKRVENFLINQDAQLLLALVDKKESKSFTRHGKNRETIDFYCRELSLHWGSP